MLPNPMPRIDIVLQSPSKVVDPSCPDGKVFEFTILAKRADTGAYVILAALNGLHAAALLVTAYDAALNGERKGWGGDKYDQQ